MQDSIEFQDEDASRVRSLAGVLQPAVPEVVNRFYEELLKHPDARSVFLDGQAQIDRLRGLLANWLGELFVGRYDNAYWSQRRRIGKAHVRVGLSQRFMFLGMELIWEELSQRIRSAQVADADRKLVSLHKLLMLELAVILESYKDSYSEQIRRVERVAVEEKLTRAEHLAEIGQLAASLAHEIKNPLAGISGAIQIMRENMATDDPHRDVAREILGQIKRLDATVKDLLQYARPAPPRASLVELDEVVRRVLTVLREEPSLQGVNIEYARPPADTTIHADEAQIEQLLLNLIINAAHAYDNGGVIVLAVVRDNERVRLTVRDYGKGMVEDVRDRAFEPFFTTKAKGTGLGLSICRKIVEAHGGEITLESTRDAGTKATVFLPHSHMKKEVTANP